MLDYTKVALNQIEKDVKTIAFISSVVTQLVYIAYLVYTLFSKTGVFAVNITLLVLSVSYFAFYIYATQQELKDKIKRTVYLICKRCKQLIRIYTLGVMIYGLYLTADNAKPASVVFAVLMVLGFFGDILFELFTKYFISRSHMMLEAMKADFEDATKPVRSVGNFFKKITGHEPAEDDPTRERQFLNERVGQVRVERKNRRLEEKYLAKQKKQELRTRKRAERAAKKQARQERLENELDGQTE